MEKAKDYMRKIEKINKMIRNKMMEVEQWKDIATSCSTHSEGERVQTSKKADPMADAVCQYTDLEQEIKKDIDGLVKTRMEIVHTIEGLNVEEYDILHRVYVQGKTLKEVAAEEKKEYSFAAALHGKALKHLQDILVKEEKKKYEKV
ncbi:MAG: hypothetical protein ACI4HI_09875 [Lachnospiraceae bacterium]